MGNITEIARLFGSDKDAERDGVWADYSPTMGIRLRRAHAGNKKYVKVLEQKMRPVRKLFEMGQLSPEKGDQILKETYAETIFVEWKGIESEPGKPLKMTHKNIMALLDDPGFGEDLWDEVKTFAQSKGHFAIEGDIEADVKN